MCQGDDRDRDVKWLNHNISPWEEVVSRWKHTTTARSIENKSKTISEIFQRWPILSNPDALYLVRIYIYYIFFANKRYRKAVIYKVFYFNL